MDEKMISTLRTVIGIVGLTIAISAINICIQLHYLNDTLRHPVPVPCVTVAQDGHNG